MTKKVENTSIATFANDGALMGLLDRPYTDDERKRRDEIVSRIRVAQDVLRARLDRGLTQEELGREAGTKQSRISDIEALKGNLRFDTLDRIARVLGLMIALIPRVDPAQERAEPVTVDTPYRAINWGDSRHWTTGATHHSHIGV